MSIYEDEILLPLDSRTATTQSPDVRAHGAGGLYLVLHVTVAGGGNAALRIQGREPFDGTYYTLNVDVTVTTAVRHIWVLLPGVARQPDGEAAATIDAGVRQVVALPVPDRFRIEIAKSTADAWTYGVALRRVRP